MVAILEGKVMHHHEQNEDGSMRVEPDNRSTLSTDEEREYGELSTRKNLSEFAASTLRKASRHFGRVERIEGETVYLSTRDAAGNTITGEGRKLDWAGYSEGDEFSIDVIVRRIEPRPLTESEIDEINAEVEAAFGVTPDAVIAAAKQSRSFTREEMAYFAMAFVERNHKKAGASKKRIRLLYAFIDSLFEQPTEKKGTE
jgi:hypothetical protein